MSNHHVHTCGFKKGNTVCYDLRYFAYTYMRSAHSDIGKTCI